MQKSSAVVKTILQKKRRRIQRLLEKAQTK